MPSYRKLQSGWRLEGEALSLQTKINLDNTSYKFTLKTIKSDTVLLDLHIQMQFVLPNVVSGLVVQPIMLTHYFDFMQWRVVMYKFGGGARNMDCKVAWVEVTLITNNGENEKYLSSKYLYPLKNRAAQTIRFFLNSKNIISCLIFSESIIKYGKYSLLKRKCVR